MKNYRAECFGLPELSHRSSAKLPLPTSTSASQRSSSRRADRLRPADDDQTNSFNPTGMATMAWTVFLIANIAWAAFLLISNTTWAGHIATTSWAQKPLEIVKFEEMMGLQGPLEPLEIVKFEEKEMMGLQGPLEPWEILKFEKEMMGLEGPQKPLEIVKLEKEMMGLEGPMKPLEIVKFEKEMMGLEGPLEPLEIEKFEKEMGPRRPPEAIGDREV